DRGGGNRGGGVGDAAGQQQARGQCGEGKASHRGTPQGKPDYGVRAVACLGQKSWPSTAGTIQVVPAVRALLLVLQQITDFGEQGDIGRRRGRRLLLLLLHPVHALDHHEDRRR